MSDYRDVFRRAYKTTSGDVIVATTGSQSIDDEIMHNTIVINCLKNGNMMFMDHNFNKISDTIEPKYGALVQGDIGLKRLNRFCHHAILHTITIPDGNNITLPVLTYSSERSGGSDKSSNNDGSSKASNLHLTIVQGGDDGYIRLYHVSPMRNVKKFPEEKETLVIPVRDQPCKITSVHLYVASVNNVYDSDKLYIIASSSLGYIYIWNALELGNEINTIETATSTKNLNPIIRCMTTFCPGNDLNPVVIIGDSNCHIKIFDTLTGEKKNNCIHGKTIDTNKRAGIQSIVCYSPSIHGFGNKNANGDTSETVIISSSVDKSIIIWAYDSLDKLREINGHTDVVSSLSVTCLSDPYNPVIASGSDDCTVRLWLFSSGEELRRLKPHIKLDKTLMDRLRARVYTYDYHDLKPKKITSVSVCMFGSYRDALVLSSGDDGNLMLHNFGASECIKSINSKLKLQGTIDSMKSRSDTPTDIHHSGNITGTNDTTVSEFTYDSTQEHYVTSTFALPSQWMYLTYDDNDHLSDADASIIRKSLDAFTAGLDKESNWGSNVVKKGVEIIKSNFLAGRKLSTAEKNSVGGYNLSAVAAPSPKNKFYTSHPLILSVIDEKIGLVKFWSATESKYDKIIQLGDYLNYDHKFKLNLIRPVATSTIPSDHTSVPDDDSNYLVMTCYRGIQIINDGQPRPRSLTNRALSRSDDADDVAALESNNKYNKHHYLTLWELRKDDIKGKDSQPIIDKKEYIGHKNVVKCVIIFDATAVGGMVIIASGDADGNILFWDAKSPSGSEPIGVIRAHKGLDDYGVNVLAVSEVFERDAPYTTTWPFLFSGGGDKLLKMWQINDVCCNNAYVRTQTQPKSVKPRDLRTSSLNTDLADDDDDDVDETNILVEYEHESPVTCISFTKAESLGAGMHNKEKYSTLVITGTIDGVIRLWSTQHTMAPLVKIVDTNRSGINTMDVYQSRDLNWNWVVAGTIDGSIKVYDIRNKKLIREYNHSLKKIKSEVSHRVRNAPIKSLAIIAPSITTGLPIKEPIIYSINENNDIDVWDTYYSCYSTEPLSGYIIRHLFCYDRNDLKHRYGAMLKSTASMQQRNSIVKRGSSKMMKTTNTIITGRLVSEDILDNDDDTSYSYVESTNQNVDPNGDRDSKKEDSIAYKWPRLYHAFEDRGGNVIFKENPLLMWIAIDKGMTDFVEYFLPLYQQLVCTNYSLWSSVVTDDISSLLNKALSVKGRADVRSVRVILNCWQSLLTNYTGDSMFYHFFYFSKRLPKKDLLLLGKKCPLEFTAFIRTLKPVTAHSIVSEGCDHAKLRAGEVIVKGCSNSSIAKHVWSTYSSTTSKSRGKVAATQVRAQFLPLNHTADIDMLECFCHVSDELNSVDIFASEVGMRSLQFAWNTFGRKVHIFAMTIYIIFVFTFTTSLYIFSSYHHGERHTYDNSRYYYLSIILQYFVLAFSAYFVVIEIKQSRYNKSAFLQHLQDPWNFLDLSSQLIVIAGTLLRIIYDAETQFSKCILAVASILLWAKILYYLRAFEDFGIIVSMVFVMGYDIRHFLMILLIFIIGFSFSFWLLEMGNEYSEYRTVSASLFSLYQAMFGQFTSSPFYGSDVKSFSIILYVVYGIVVTILMLNLLIALMNNSYSTVNKKGVAQWRLEQAKIIIDQSFLIPRRILFPHLDLNYFPETIHILKRVADISQEQRESKNNMLHSGGNGNILTPDVASNVNDYVDSELEVLNNKISRLDIKINEMESHMDAKISEIDAKLDTILLSLLAGSSDGARQRSNSNISAASHHTREDDKIQNFLDDERGSVINRLKLANSNSKMRESSNVMVLDTDYSGLNGNNSIINKEDISMNSNFDADNSHDTELTNKAKSILSTADSPKIDFDEVDVIRVNNHISFSHFS